MEPSTSQAMQMSDKEACEESTPKEASKDMKKSPKKAKEMCSHLLIDKWVMHKQEFLTPLLSSDDDIKSENTSEDKDPHNVAYTWARKKKAKAEVHQTHSSWCSNMTYKDSSNSSNINSNNKNSNCQLLESMTNHPTSEDTTNYNILSPFQGSQTLQEQVLASEYSISC